MQRKAESKPRKQSKEGIHMIELVHTIAPKEPLDVIDVCSFLTENYVGLWDCDNNQYV